MNGWHITGAVLSWGGLNYMAAICCMMVVWLANNCFMPMVTSGGMATLAVAAYVLPSVLVPVVAIAAVCVTLVALLSVLCSLGTLLQNMLNMPGSVTEGDSCQVAHVGIVNERFYKRVGLVRHRCLCLKFFDGEYSRLHENPNGDVDDLRRPIWVLINGLDFLALLDVIEKHLGCLHCQEWISKQCVVVE